MTKAGETLDVAVLAGLAGAPGQAGPIFGKIIDRDGRVVDVTWRGVAAAQAPGDAETAVWSAFWTLFWTGAEATTAAGLVECAFGGKANEFLGQFQIAGEPSSWEVEALPLDWQDGIVSRVLILATRLSPPVPTIDPPSSEPEGFASHG